MIKYKLIEVRRRYFVYHRYYDYERLDGSDQQYIDRPDDKKYYCINGKVAHLREVRKINKTFIYKSDII